MLRWRSVVPPAADGLPRFAPRRRPASARRTMAELPVLVAIALVIAFTLKTFVAQAFVIPSLSMDPQLEIGDRVVVSRLAYRLHEPRRGDIVVFHEPGRESSDTTPFPIRVVRDLFEGAGVLRPSDTELIKRVIGLPGETVEGREGRVFIDGQELVEPYLPEATTTSTFGPVTVPAEHLFMMGDKRGLSEDSRAFGPVPISSIVGRAIVRAWPPTRWAFL